MLPGGSGGLVEAQQVTAVSLLRLRSLVLPGLGQEHPAGLPHSGLPAPPRRKREAVRFAQALPVGTPGPCTPTTAQAARDPTAQAGPRPARACSATWAADPKLKFIFPTVADSWSGCSSARKGICQPRTGRGPANPRPTTRGQCALGWPLRAGAASPGGARACRAPAPGGDAAPGTRTPPPRPHAPVCPASVSPAAPGGPRGSHSPGGGAAGAQSGRSGAERSASGGAPRCSGSAPAGLRGARGRKRWRRLAPPVRRGHVGSGRGPGRSRGWGWGGSLGRPRPPARPAGLQ